MTEIEKMILENQEVIMSALSILLTPHCKGFYDRNGETKANVCLIDNYHKTRKMLGKE